MLKSLNEVVGLYFVQFQVVSLMVRRASASGNREQFIVISFKRVVQKKLKLPFKMTKTNCFTRNNSIRCRKFLLSFTSRFISEILSVCGWIAWIRIWVNSMKETFIFTEASKSHKVMDGKGIHDDDDPESKTACAC